MGGQVGKLPTHVLANQSILSQTEGADCSPPPPPTLLLGPPTLGSFLRHWSEVASGMYVFQFLPLGLRERENWVSK